MKIHYPDSLPVCERREEIVRCIKENPVVIISGATGSGKTTQIPKMCLEAGLGKRKKIGCTQPRRVAALSVAQRLSEELKVPYGSFVGSKIRFDDKTSDDTRIQVMTDGILLQEFQNDPLLKRYDCLIIDEAHERSLNIDFILGLLKELLRKRKELKIVITSATIDTQKFSKAFYDAPIVEVSGTLYPIETIYRPIDSDSNMDGDNSYIELAAEAAQELVKSGNGDVLVFLPTEADIRECQKVLEGQLVSKFEVIPLFGRLSSKDQVRIFHPGNRERIILSTNIAETSVTVPRIKSVVDSGLVRISRYSHSTGTLHLPIEKISRSSANQRKGRCGRLGPGICVRLYDEEDFEQRDEFTEPEIYRTNLGSVLLRLLSLKYSNIEDFPFIDSPEKKVIRASFRQLLALGAIDKKNHMTSIGQDLVRLPIDLSVGRMMLEAQKKGVLQEVAIIGAALCIQDPRERPEDKCEHADKEHQRFIHPESDFLTLFNIWATFHDEMEGLSLNKLRKFCKKHYLSFMRMREWMDIHRQILSCFGAKKKVIPKEIAEKDYENIHRAILSGLLLQVSQKVTGNTYKATRDRELSIFPGSGLFDKNVFKQQRKALKTSYKPIEDPDLGNTPPWIVAATISETSKTFARTVARIEPDWIMPLAKHILKKSYNEPYWSAKSGRVLVHEKCRIYGLLIAENRVGYGSVDPLAAKDIFVRCALVNREVTVRVPLLEGNWKTFDQAKQELSSSRNAVSWQLEDRLCNFFNERIPSISSIPELQKWLSHEENKEQFKLRLTDLIDDDWSADEKKFPLSLQMGDQSYPIKYHFKPGDEKDGATLCLKKQALNYLSDEILDWAIPGYLEEKVECYLRGLPKNKRTLMFPLADAVKRISQRLEPGNYSLKKAIQSAVKAEYSVVIESSEIEDVQIPDPLKVRVELCDKHGKIIVASRQLSEIFGVRELRGEAVQKVDDSLWKKVREQCELSDLSKVKDFVYEKSLPVGKVGGITTLAYPGLQIEKDNRVALRLFSDEQSQVRESRKAFKVWMENILSRDLAWIQKDLRDVRKRCALAYAALGKIEDLENDLYLAILKDAMNRHDVLPVDSRHYEKWIEELREDWRGLVPRLIDSVLIALEMRNEFLIKGECYPQSIRDLKTLLPARFARQTPLGQFTHIPRYLRAMELRGQRYKNNPNKDTQKYTRVARYENYFYQTVKKGSFTVSEAEQLGKYFWLLQEFKVSVFAPELKTPIKISVKVLECNQL